MKIQNNNLMPKRKKSRLRHAKVDEIFHSAGFLPAKAGNFSAFT
jgi:hypothetical protein